MKKNGGCMKASVFLLLIYTIITTDLNIIISDICTNLSLTHPIFTLLAGVFIISAVLSNYKKIIMFFISSVVKSNNDKIIFLVTFSYLFLLKVNV